jgi:hypothetical protein
LEETQQAVLAEVGRYKTERQKASVRDRFRRIVFWMERYVEPLIEIVRADGPLRGTFDEIERLLRAARQQVLFNDHPALERNLRFLRLVGAHALRVFVQCRKEIQPLYDSLRRSSLIAEGAARALERLQNEGLAGWETGHLIGICSVRYQNVPGDPAITRALRRVFEHQPEPPPMVSMTVDDSPPQELLLRIWVDSLEQEIQPELPVPDLLHWLVNRYPDKSTAAVLAGFSKLVFERGLQATFKPDHPRQYATRNGAITAAPVELTAA